MKLNINNPISHTDIYAAIGKEIPLRISQDWIEIPDDLKQTEIDTIKNMIYPDATTWNSLTIAQKIEFIAKKLGLIP